LDILDDIEITKLVGQMYLTSSKLLI